MFEEFPFEKKIVQSLSQNQPLLILFHWPRLEEEVCLQIIIYSEVQRLLWLFIIEKEFVHQ